MSAHPASARLAVVADANRLGGKDLPDQDRLDYFAKNLQEQAAV